VLFSTLADSFTVFDEPPVVDAEAASAAAIPSAEPTEVSAAPEPTIPATKPVKRYGKYRAETTSILERW
jgi:hypothetical protein